MHNSTLACCWAKTVCDAHGRARPGITVRDHCLNVGCVAGALIERLSEPLRRLVPRGVLSLAAAHDVGKIAPGFQRKCEAWLVLNNLSSLARQEDWANHESDHARVSQWVLQKKLGSSKLEPWAAVAGAHHGRIKGNHLGPLQIGPVGGPDWDQARLTLLDELMSRFGPLPDQPAPTNALLWFVAGLITVADWIGSDENFVRAAVWAEAPTWSQAAQSNHASVPRWLSWPVCPVDRPDGHPPRVRGPERPPSAARTASRASKMPAAKATQWPPGLPALLSWPHSACRLSALNLNPVATPRRSSFLHRI